MMEVRKKMRPAFWRKQDDLSSYYQEDSKDGAGLDKKLEIVDLSGMSLDVLPTPPLNLAFISKLDLSNNNFQVKQIFQTYNVTLLIFR